jgi:hypothetical protein
MQALTNAKSLFTKVAGRPLALASKYSPEILLGLGAVGMVASTVLACKATLRIDEINSEANYKLAKIRNGRETMDEEQYTDEEYKKDLGITYIQTGVNYLKLYGPSVTLGIVSMGLIFSSYGILSKRHTAAMAAYKVLEDAFSKYRERVVDSLGDEKDRAFRFPSTEEKITVEETDSEGKVKKLKKTVTHLDPEGLSEYARFFDKMSSEWHSDPEYNLMFLRTQQNYANDLLRCRLNGIVFLNEIYTMLGIPISEAGQVVGWVRGNTDGDGYISFGIYDDNARDFVNGYNDSILLDFNVDGLVWDKIQ